MLAKIHYCTTLYWYQGLQVYKARYNNKVWNLLWHYLKIFALYKIIYNMYNFDNKSQVLILYALFHTVFSTVDSQFGQKQSKKCTVSKCNLSDQSKEEGRNSLIWLRLLVYTSTYHDNTRFKTVWTHIQG